MRTYVSPIGYDSRRITRPVLSRGVETGDAIVLLRPRTETDDNRAKETIHEVRRMLEEIEPEITTQVEQITYNELSTAVLECSDVFIAAEGRIITILGGGARDVLLPLTIASLTHVESIDTTLTFSDIDGTVREWELPILGADIPMAAWETLSLIAAADNGVSVPDLTERSSHAKSTVSRHVTQLTERGALNTWLEGKTKFARISLTGRLALRATEG